MPITDAQREQRKKSLGSSGMAAVLGVDPWRNAHDVYLEKTGQLEPLEPTEAMQMGTLFEAPILDWAQEQLGPLRRNQRRVNGILAANIDAIVTATREPVEAKASFRWGADYGEPGTEQVPDHVIIQCHVHMVCQPSDVCHVPVFRAGSLVMYHVPYAESLGDTVRHTAAEFWTNHVQAGVPPADSPKPETLKRLIRQPGKVVTIEDPAPIAKWQRLRAARLLVAKREEAAYADALELLGDADGGECSLGTLTYLKQRGAAKVDRAGLLRDGLDKYLTETHHRVLRLKKPK